MGCGADKGLLSHQMWPPSEAQKKKSISGIGVRATSFACALFLERGRARKMRQLSINHHDTRIPCASFTCRCVAKGS